MKKWAELALGIVTGIGGFLEIGSITTAGEAGSEFEFQLVWAVIVGAMGLAFLMEMTGRLAAVSKRTYVDLLRERFGIRFLIVPMVVVFVVSLLVLASEIGGVCLALEMATGIGVRWWAIVVALVGWLLLWRGTFEIVEQGTAMVGLVSLAFLVAVIKLHPDWHALGAGTVPSTPDHDRGRYWYLAVSILGASISPYLFVFYSAGAIEDGWSIDYLGVNRVTAAVGNLFGGGLAVMVVVAAAMVLAPHHIKADSIEHLSFTLVTPLGKVGTALFVATICATCFGATMEIVLGMAYLIAQGLGWAWSENLKPVKDARFTVAWTVILCAAATIIVAGADPLALTNVSMLITAASLPVTIVPLVVLMNDRRVMSKFTNGWISNVALGVLVTISLVLFVVAVPLQIHGGQ